MSQSQSQKFDVVIIGGNLTGLMAGATLCAQGKKIAIIDRNDRLGGFDRAHQSDWGPIDHGFKFLANTAQSTQALALLQSYIPDLSWTIEEIPPLSYESAHLSPFVGFGDQPPDAQDEIVHYTCAQRLVASQPVHQWAEKLEALFTGELFLKSFVTGYSVEEGRIENVLVNGKISLTADEFVFCDHPLELLDKGIEIQGRSRQKLTKSNFWSAVHLVLRHGQLVTESQAVHVLRTPSEAAWPSIGQFFKPEGNVQCSKWLSFVPFDMTDDSELTGDAIHRMKKLIKRAYPEALNHVEKEIIFIDPGSHGHFEAGKSAADGAWKPYGNFAVAGPHLESATPTLGAILQSARVARPTGSSNETEVLPSRDACATSSPQL